MIELSNVTKKYGKRIGINSISMVVRKGEILGLLGPNGAGKSTTMRIIAGYMPPTYGRVTVAGYDVIKNPVAAKKNIGYLPENPPLYKDMTVQDYLLFAAELKGLKGKQKAMQVNEIMEQVGIADVRKRLIRHISRGYRQRVGLAQALVANPQVLILDEPTVGLDPKQIIEIRQLIKTLAGERTVILSSHILPEVSSLCHRVAIISRGKLLAENTPEELSNTLMGYNEIALHIKGPKNLIYSAISQIPYVKNIKVKRKVNENLWEYIVQTEKFRDIREDIFNIMAQRGFPILEMRPCFLSLEDIFLELVTEERM